jgi:8-oxo-dGTP diphosphatase
MTVSISAPSNNGTQLNPNVSIDCVVLGFDAQRLQVLLIERKDKHSIAAKGDKPSLALPGNLVKDGEDLDQSAQRILKELTGIEDIYLEQFGAFGNPKRVQGAQDAKWLQTIREQPKARVITIAYFALVKPDNYHPKPDSFAQKSGWHPIQELPRLAFDHNDIIDKALETLRFRVTHSMVGFELLPPKFTLGQLQGLYEAILGRELDKRNFRRRMKLLNLIVPLREKQIGVSHKPSTLYKFNMKVYQQLKAGILS